MVGSLLVALQLGLIAVLVWHSGAVLGAPWSLAGLVVSGLWMVWAVGSMPRKTLKVHPSPARDGVLCQHRAYRWVRHPMYGAILFGALMVAWADGGWLAFCCWLALILVLWIKSSLEERWLAGRYPEYPQYRLSTPRWFPLWPMGNDKWWKRLGRCAGWGLLVFVLASLGWQAYEGSWDADLFDGKTARNIRAREAVLLMESDPNLWVLDVRSEREFAGRRLPGAVNIPLNDPGFDEKLSKGIEGKSSILVYCTGGYRSRQAFARIQKQKTHLPLYHLHRGMLEWWWRLVRE
jgi:rhodanese-related sulfurtransferase/protein-S-isoprenylcysteine O-methyltransferase Ste14